MAKRKLCNFAHASEEVPVKGAMYQRGQFYIIEDNKRKGDRRRYRVMINDSLLGFGGSLVRVKRFVNDMYKAFPFAEDVGDDMADKVKRFGRRAQMELRPSFKPNKQKSKTAGKKTGRPSASKKSAGKTTAGKQKPKQPKRKRQQFLFETDVVDVSNNAISLMIDRDTTKRAMSIIQDFQDNGQFTKAQYNKVMKAFNAKKRDLIIRDIRRDPEGGATARDILKIISNAKRNPTKRITAYFERNQKLKTETLKQFLNDFDSPLFRLIQMYVDTWG
jgi:hypothetical protein